MNRSEEIRAEAILWLEEEEIPRFAIKVAPIYQVLSWAWYSKGVPNAAAIEETLRGLMIHVKKGSLYAETGGLRIELDEMKEPAVARISMIIDGTKYWSTEHPVEIVGWVNAPHELDLNDGLQLVRKAQMPGVKIAVIDEDDFTKHCAERGLGPDSQPMRLQPKSAVVLYKGEGDVLKAWVDKLLK